MTNNDKIDWHSKISDILSRDHDFAGSRDLSDFRIWNDFFIFSLDSAQIGALCPKYKTFKFRKLCCD